MNKKNVEEQSSGRIEIVSKREPKKITQQKDPFARINLHPLEDIQESTNSNKDNSTPTSTPTSTHVNQFLEIAPTKNFHRVANSINREAIEKGLFDRPSYKVVYDVLYLLTRGNIVPSRKTRISKEQLQKKSGLGSRVTLDGAIVHLQAVGLLRVNIIGGKQGGNEYEVLLPEEINLNNTNPSTPSRDTSTPSRDTSTSPRISTPSSPGQNLETLETLETTPSSTPINSINIESIDMAKTLSNTKEEKRIDDEPAAAFRSHNEKINQVFKELTGREATPSDEQKLAQLGELIAAELMEAAARTKVVSDPAAFLLTHLRRRLGVRSIKVETLSEKETGKGTAASTKPLRQEIPLTDDEIQECPDCQGRLLIYPQGPGKGAVMCKHLSLIKAKQSEHPKQSEEKKEEGK